MNQFDISALLIWRLIQVHNVKLSGIPWMMEKPTFWQVLDVTISLTLFPLCNELLLFYLLSPHKNYNSVHRYECFHHNIFDGKYIIFLTPHYGENI